MQKQTMNFATQKENGVITQIGRSALYQPKTVFKDTGCTAGHKDTLKNGAQQVQK